MLERKNRADFVCFSGKQVKSISRSLQDELYVYFYFFQANSAFTFLRWLKSVFAQLSDGHA